MLRSLSWWLASPSVHAWDASRKPNRLAAVEEVPPALMIPTWVLIGGSIYFSLDTELSVGVAKQAAMQLLGVGG